MGKTVPSLNALLQICYRIGISVPNFLTGEVATDFNQIITQQGNQPPPQPSSFNGQLFDPDRMIRIQGQLIRVLQENPPLSLKEVALRVGCCRTTLYNNFPDLIRKIAARHTSYRQQCHAELIARLCQEV